MVRYPFHTSRLGKAECAYAFIVVDKEVDKNAMCAQAHVNMLVLREEICVSPRQTNAQLQSRTAS